MAYRPVQEFDTDCPENWQEYKDSILNYFVANNVKSDKRKLANLKYLGGSKLCNILKLLPPLEIDMNCTVSLLRDKGFPKAIKQLDDYFESKTNSAYFVLKFKELKQDAKETAKQFALRLRDIANRCELTDIEEQIKNQLMWGTCDAKLKRLLAKKKHVDVNEIIEEEMMDVFFSFIWIPSIGASAFMVD